MLGVVFAFLGSTAAISITPGAVARSTFGSTHELDLVVALAVDHGVSIEVVPSSGGEPRRVRFLAGADAAVVSPDGSRVAVVRGRSLGLEPLGGRGHETVTRNLSGEPAWSADGRRLAFADRGSIVVFDLQSHTRRGLTTGDRPVWSPGGTQLAFTRYQPHPGPVEAHETVPEAVGVVDLRSGRARLISRYRFDAAAYLAWQPDARRVGVLTYAGDITILVVSRANAPAWVTGSYLEAFSWSHQGQTIATADAANATSAAGPRSFVALVPSPIAGTSVSARSTRARRIASRRISGGITAPVWSPGDRLIAFAGCRGAYGSDGGSLLASGPCAVYIVGSASLRMRAVASLPDNMCGGAYGPGPCDASLASIAWRRR